MAKVTTEYTDYHRKAINLLSWLSVSLTVVTVDINGKYKIKSGHWIGKVLYVFVTMNTFVKLVYLLFLIFGFFGQVDFLDKMSALLWILMCGEILQELNLWARKYPLFEILAQLWIIENRIFEKLGKPVNTKKKLDNINWNTVFIHTCICLIGDSFIVIQFLAAPKYSVYTYAAIKEESQLLLIIFSLHEFLFLWQAWNGYVSVVCLSSINASELTTTLEAMTETLKSLQNLQPNQPVTPVTTNTDLDKISNVYGKTVPNYQQIAPGTKYDIKTLLFDYKQLILVVDQLNDWCAYKIVGVHCIGYCQFISDVFMMTQLLSLPDFDLFSVLWFLEDSLACILMLLRMFTIMSRVNPASQSFISAFKKYLVHENPVRRELRKTLHTLKLVSINLGPSPVVPATVNRAMFRLLNYYICVALWPPAT